MNKVDAFFSQWDTNQTPGCVLAVIRDSAIIYERAYGMADLERHVPLSTQSVFDIGSIGKQFTAMLIALLAQERRLALDDSIHTYVPELPDYGDPIAIRHLIHHTSGLLDYCTLMGLANMPFENRYDEDELLALITRQKLLNFKPGDEFLYSNTGYFLLGIIAQRVAGRPLTTLLREYILDRLGMKATTFNGPMQQIVKNRAVGYAPAGNEGYYTEISFCGPYGDGPLFSTIGDLFLWDQNFYHNQLGDGSQQLIDLMQTPGVLNSGEALDYAFGLAVREYRGAKMVSHSGGWAGYVSHMLRFPEQNFSVIVLANLNNMPVRELALQVADLYLSDVFTPAETPAVEPSPVTLSSQQIEALTGFYRSEKSGSILELNGLTLQFYDTPLPLIAYSPTRLKTTGGGPSIEIDVLDETRLNVTFYGQTETYSRVNVAPPQAGEIEACAGDYYSQALSITYHVTAEDGQLFIRRGYAPRQKLSRVTTGVYLSEHLVFEFAPDGSSLDVLAGRVKQVAFVRLA